MNARKLVMAVQNVSRYYSGTGASPIRRIKRAKILRGCQSSLVQRRVLRQLVRSVYEKGGMFLI